MGFALAGVVQLVEHLPWLLHLQLLCACPEPDLATGQVESSPGNPSGLRNCHARLQLTDDVWSLIGSLQIVAAAPAMPMHVGMLCLAARCALGVHQLACAVWPHVGRHMYVCQHIWLC